MRLSIVCAGALVAASLASPLLARSNVRLASNVLVERTNHSTDGRQSLVLEPTEHFLPGDSVVLMLEWQSAVPAADGKGFTVTSAVPPRLTYQRSARETQIVSVDGGRSWGRIGELRVLDGAASRMASPEDVTHLRWQIPARLAARGRGTVSFKAVVR